MTSIKTSTSKTTFSNLKAAQAACEKAERSAKCPSAKKRFVFRVVRIARGTYIVASTPWAYRLQAEGRGEVC